jgi:hypothetical protein
MKIVDDSHLEGCPVVSGSCFSRDSCVDCGVFTLAEKALRYELLEKVMGPAAIKYWLEAGRMVRDG